MLDGKQLRCDSPLRRFSLHLIHLLYSYHELSFSALPLTALYLIRPSYIHFQYNSCHPSLTIWICIHILSEASIGGRLIGPNRRT
ncbi:hypothetical protein JOM56_012035 [Amanita muscaria]